MYGDDYTGYYPWSPNPGLKFGGTGWNWNDNADLGKCTALLLNDYVHAKIFVCPSDPTPKNYRFFSCTVGLSGSDISNDKFGCSVVFNEISAGKNPTMDTMIKVPTRFFMATEGTYICQSNLSRLSGTSYSADAESAGTLRRDWDHGARVNFVLADGHVETVNAAGRLDGMFIQDFNDSAPVLNN